MTIWGLGIPSWVEIFGLSFLCNGQVLAVDKCCAIIGPVKGVQSAPVHEHWL